MKRHLPVILAALVSTTLAKETSDDKKPIPSLDEVLFDENLWTKSLETLKAPEVEEDKEDKERRERLKERGITLPKQNHGLDWVSKDQDGLRADPKCYQLLGKDVGEVVVRGREGKPAVATVSLYNRGDDGEISFQAYTTRFTEWKAALDAKMGVRAQSRDQKDPVPTTGWVWTKGDTAVLLEGSVSRTEKRAEFLRLRLVSVSGAKKAPSGMAARNSFAANVKKSDDGFTYIDGIPMVDQGKKGYCVVASVERVARYFGADIDQHEMAQLAQTDEDGTNGDKMEKAFQKVTGKIHLRTLKHIEYDEKQLEKDVKAYNRQAKHDGTTVYDVDPDKFYINPRHFWAKANKDTFRKMKASQAGFAHFNGKIKDYVDQGIPLCWTLYLGMFPEKGLPQSYGGHMRLIIGYNEATKMIYYTDSWGEGHERKSMPADEAYCMTMALYTMVPNR